MPWFYVDDRLATHPKAITAGNTAMGLWVRAGSWSSAHETDGYIPTSAAGMLSAPEPCTEPARKRARNDTDACAERLVTAGLWVPSAGGYQFHDWGQWQRTRDEREATREARRLAGRNGGLAKSGRARAVADA